MLRGKVQREIPETRRLEKHLSIETIVETVANYFSEIGNYFNIGYTAVSQSVARLKREIKIKKDLLKVLQEIEIRLK